MSDADASIRAVAEQILEARRPNRKDRRLARTVAECFPTELAEELTRDRG